ncbi:MAG: hypothetical protein NVS9B4_20530 [Candidatus Acidiferrum sp.]
MKCPSGPSQAPQWMLVLAILLAVLLSGGAALAQVSSASLNGTVRDSSGGVLANANVLLRNVDTSIEHTATSNETGNYVFLNLPPGKYTLEVSADGFSSKHVEQFVLGVNQTPTIDVALAVGSQKDIVSVVAEAEQLQASTADLGTVISTKQVNDLPLNGRNFTQLLSLTPGVAPISVSQNNMGGSGFSAPVARGSAVNFPAINGQTNRSNYFLTDGLINQGSFLSTYAVPPIVDSIQEFKVVSHTDEAQFGSVLGGVVNVVSKSGTNDYHGSVWEYLRNNAFDARNTFSTRVAPFRQNQFGASFGGPVWIPKAYNGKNRTFFFVAYQGFRYTRSADSNLRVPNAAEYAGDLGVLCGAGSGTLHGTFDAGGICRNSSGAIVNQLYDPFSTVASGTSFTRTAFPFNRIPTSRIQANLVAYAQAILPAATGSGDGLLGQSNAVDPTPIVQHQNEVTFRIDQNFGTKNTIFFRYSLINSTTTASAGLPKLGSSQEVPARNWGASYMHVFNPSLIMQVQYGRSTVADNTTNRFKGVPASVVSAVGFAPGFNGGYTTAGSLIPGPGIGGFSNAGEAVNLTPKATDSHQFAGDLTKITGNHTLHFGGGFTSNNFASPLAQLSISFANSQTGDPSNPSSPGNALASYLLGVPDGANRRDVNEKTRPGGVMSLYIQDSWKATPRLTLNLGLRYDRTFLPPYGTSDTIAQHGGIETGDVDLNSGTYILQAVPPPCSVRGFAPCIPSIMLDASGNAVNCKPSTQTCLPPGTLPPHVVVDPRGQIPHDTKTNFGPRIGLAYRFGDKTVIRASAGIVYDNWAAVSQTAQNFEGSWPDIGQQISSQQNSPTVANPTPTVTYQNPFGGSGLFPAATPFHQVQWFYDPNIKNAYSIQYNFGIQREIGSSASLTVNYVGSGSRRLNVGGVYNVAKTPGPGDFHLRAPFPYIDPTFWDHSVGKGSYNALQVNYDKKLKAGLAYQVSYTWSKSIDECSSGWFGVEGQSCTDPYNIKGSRGPSGFDIPHVLSANVVYELPIGKGKRFTTGNGVADYVLGNWQLNTIFLARSGTNYSVIDSNDVANTGNFGWTNYERANLVGDPNSGSCPNGSSVHTVNCWFNTSAFAIPAQFTFGNSGRNIMRADHFWNVDMSVFRQFPFWREGRRLEFRAEAFNLLNHVVYAAPNRDITSGGFGKVTGTANSARVMQFGLKIIF